MSFFLLGTQGDYISQHPLPSVWSCDWILANGKWVEARMVYETLVYSNYPFSSPPSGWEWKDFWGHTEQQSLGRGWAGRRLDSWVTAYKKDARRTTTPGTPALNWVRNKLLLLDPPKFGALSELLVGSPHGKESTICQCRRHRFNPCIGKIPGEGNGNPLQYSCPGNPMDRGARPATVHEAAKELAEEILVFLD